MPQAWQREQLGIAGLQEDMRAIYTFVAHEVASTKTFLLNELSKIRGEMATYSQAVDDAIAELGDLNSKLQAALAANDQSAVQAAADKLENAVNALKDAHAAGPVDAPADPTPAPVDQPPATPPAGTDTPVPDPAPETPAGP